MRFLTLKLSPVGGIHPARSAIADAPGVTRKALLHVDPLPDGTGILLYELEGNADGLADRLAAREDVLDVGCSESVDGGFHAYLHVAPGEPAGRLVQLAQKYALVVDTPLTFDSDGALEVTIIGPQDRIQDAFRELPADLGSEVMRIGDYLPDTDPLLSQLTSRQLEVVQQAKRLGYYEFPRRATHEDIAAELDCSSSTVDEHLRKAEANLLPELLR